MIKAKPKPCPICEEYYMPFQSFQKCCPKPACANEMGKKANKIKQEKQYAKDATIYRKANKKKTTIKMEAQAAFNFYVRMRDYYRDCASCCRSWDSTTEWDCGHYRATGNANHMRFRLDNCYKQCVHCNRSGKGLGGNYVEYRKRLVIRFGEDKILEIEHDQDIKPMSKYYLERIKKIFNKKARRQKKRLGIE